MTQWIHTIELITYHYNNVSSNNKFKKYFNTMITQIKVANMIKNKYYSHVIITISLVRPLLNEEEVQNNVIF